MLPLPLGRHELGAQGSNLEVSAFKARRVCRFPLPPIKSRHSVSSRTACFTRAGPQPCVAAECPRPDSNRHCRSPQDRDSCRWSTETREPPPGVEPGHPPYEGEAAAVRGGQAAPHGFEPRFTASEAAVLPLDERASSTGDASRTRMPRGLSSRGLPVAVTPAYAARGSNSVPRIKSPVHHQSCLQRSRAVPGSRTPMRCLEGTRLSR